ncbi:MFS transporter [Alkalibacter rhizosphaerae]|uniref:MFS transporter n=1 Tax=Alkalibacter rhizosphaerae TaxID=2815577 RepID=A0A974XIJ7_9FIRM|nr:glycoside-pentoside-hexuronide (GPH):cation symporter [Alkalibacter rhizosphaerae]QSX09405.1 MFS transporter [Alkalibacter rhizosphaerae]
MEQDNGKGIVSTKELLAFSLAYMGLQVGGLSANYLSYFWTDIALIPLAAVSTIMLVSRLLDGVTDIIIGFMVDKTKSKHGKARPWLLWMTPPAVVSMVLLFWMPDIGVTGKVVYAFVVYNAVAFFFSTAVTIPLQTLTSRITSRGDQRLRLNMVGQTFGSLTAVLGNFFVVGAIAALGGDNGGYFRFFGIMAILAGALMYVGFFGTREKVQEHKPKQAAAEKKLTVGQGFKVLLTNKYWVWVTLLQVSSWMFPAFMAINIYYMIWILHNPAFMGPFMSIIFAAMFGAMLILTPLSRKIGKASIAFLGMFLQVAGGLVPLIAPTSMPILILSAILRGAGPAAMLGTRLAYTSDVVEYGEWKTGMRTEGLIFSATSMGQKIGLGLGGAIVTTALAVGGYVGGAETQTEGALSAIMFTFTWLSAAASGLAVICLFFLSRLTKEMPQILADLEARNGTEE